jgi:putative ABC transport system permease protein
MIKNYLLITLRGMTKNKLFVIINVFGMGIAIACSIVAFLAYRYDATFDHVHENNAALYRVGSIREFDKQLTPFGYTALPMGEIVRNIPDVSGSTRYIETWKDIKRDDDLFSVNFSYVDPEFFQMFSWEFISGNSADLKRKENVFISETMAVRLFGSAQMAFGKTFTQLKREQNKELRIAGVFRDPISNSSFFKKEGSVYIGFESYKDDHGVREDDWTKECTVFVQINDAGNVSTVHTALQGYVENNNKVRDDFQVVEFVLDPLTTMAREDRKRSVRASTWAAPPIAAIIGSVIGSVVMAILLLLIACFNLTNTAIAISSRRLKEIGIRKVMGSMRLQLIIQFIGETTFICFLALLVGLGLTDILIEGWNIMTSNNIHLSANYFDSPAFLAFLVGMLLCTGVLAGSYPAFYISRFEPVNILKGKLKFGGTNYFTRILLGLQFTFSLIAIVNAIGFFQNARYQEQYDLGFDVRGTVIATVNNKSEFETYRNALQSNDEILSVAGARTGIFSSPHHEPVKHQSKETEVDIIYVGENYLKAMDLKLVEGRDFMEDSETDQKESVIVTENMAKLFQWENPIGKEIVWKDSVKLYVVGVVMNVYTRGLWREMEPMMIRYVLPEQYTQLVVSAKADNIAAVNAFMSSQWKIVFSDRLYNGRMLMSQLQQVIDLNHSAMMAYAFLGIIALLLSASGLFTLVSLNVIRRMKEIGVRKVMGASVANISRIINTEFIIVLAIASALGSFASYNMSNVILGSIWKYYQAVNATTLSIAIGILFTVSLVTIAYKVIGVARINPVKTLRDE